MLSMVRRVQIGPYEVLELVGALHRFNIIKNNVERKMLFRVDSFLVFRCPNMQGLFQICGFLQVYRMSHVASVGPVASSSVASSVMHWLHSAVSIMARWEAVLLARASGRQLIFVLLRALKGC